MKEDRERVERLERDLNNEKQDVSKLKSKLVNHLNLTKMVLLSLVFIPFFIGDIYAWASQWFYTKTGTEWVEQAFSNEMVNVDKGYWTCLMVHDSLSGAMYVFGFAASAILILVAYYFCYWCWKEEVG